MTITTVLVVVIGIALPFSTLAAALGFAPLPVAYFAFLAAVASTYLLVVEVVKRRRLMRRPAT